MMINFTDFFFGGGLYYKDPQTGDCYQLSDPSLLYTKRARNEIMPSNRFRRDDYNDQLTYCQEKIMREAKHNV
jgi:hypothetical protein